MRRQTRPSSRRRVTSPGRNGRSRKAGSVASRRAPAAPRPVAGLTTRAAVLGLVLCALVVTLAIPLRELLAQRSQIAGLQADQSAAEQRVAELAQQKRLLEDPTYVAALARQRLHFVKPGETAYVVLAPEQPPKPAAAPAPRVNADARSPWYSQLWGSVEEADKPVPQP